MLINTHTHYSLKYGVLKTEQLLELAQKIGYSTLALTDVNNTSACLNFIRMAPEYGIKPVVGIDFRNSAEQKYVGIAINNEGFQELNSHLSHHLHGNEKFLPTAPEFNHAYIIYPFASYEGWALKENEFIGVKPSDLPRLRFSKWLHLMPKMVAMPTCTFTHKKHFNAHRLLRAIDKNTLLSKLPESEQAPQDDWFLTKEQLNQTYEGVPTLLDNAKAILESCGIQFTFKDPSHHENRRYYKDSEQDDRERLWSLCQEGLPYRYPNPSKEIYARLNKEIDLITQKGFTGYFLMNWDIVNYARKNGYYYVGRGSGANSIVAYLLKITDVDPIELDLYFERFINLYRQNPPDFDIDFSWKDRDDVTDYIFKKYDKAALIGTYSTFKYRAVIRELGKVFGLPKMEIDKLASANYDPSKLDQLSRLVLNYGKLIDNFPNHISVHASGIVIPQRDIHYFGGTFMPPKGFRTTQFSMIEAEDVGLYKFDILSQRGLGKIKDCLEVISKNQPDNPPADIRNASQFFTDDKCNELLKNGTAIGCFYVESPAMRMLLSKLEVDDYLGLVAASSIIRPGVAKSGMMREYILRHRNKEWQKESHETMADIMPETYGIMVYQEDVIKVAHHFAGLTLGEADELRRGMSGKYRSRDEFMKVKDKYFENCRAKDYSEKLTQEVWEQIMSFAGYAFSKGHSASYAVESYQCLYLKAYYPLEYMVATLNNWGGFYRPEVYVHEARMHGATIHPPCVNRSDQLAAIYGKDIFLGLSFINGLESSVVKKILVERITNGDYGSFEDFVDRVPISLDQITLLIRIDAFRFGGANKRELLWKAHYAVSKKKVVENTGSLFSVGRKNLTIPELERHEHEDTFDQMELLGYPLSNPFRLARNQDYERVMAKDLPSYLGKEVTIRGYMVARKNTGTSKGQDMNFGTFLDEDGYFIDTVHFPDSARKYPFRGRGIYTVTGMVVEEFGFYSIEVSHQRKELYVEDD